VLLGGLALLVLAYVGVCFYAIYYFYLHYEQIAIWRQGRYTTHDFVVGVMVAYLVLGDLVVRVTHERGRDGPPTSRPVEAARPRR
jgi:TRAP-type uncharacterized transport system fused permease subunit